MAKNKERLCLAARYIHTGNSGVTFYVNRDVEKPDRAVLLITNGAFGAFSTEMQVRGEDCLGMTSSQLRDLALMFMDSAAYLDVGKLPLLGERIAPIVSDKRPFLDLPPSLEDLISDPPNVRDEENARGDELVPALIREFPTLKVFSNLYPSFISEKRKNSESDQHEGGDGAVLSTQEEKERKRAKRERRFRDIPVIVEGLHLIRAWWMTFLAKEAMEAAEMRYDSALERLVPQSSDDDLRSIR